MSLVLALITAATCSDPAVMLRPQEQREAACNLLERPTLKPVGVSVTLEKIFSRPELAGARHRSGATLKVLLSRLQAWLESLFETSGAKAYANVTRVLVLAAAMLGAAWLAVRIRRRPKVTAEARVENRLEGSGIALKNPGDHLKRARELLNDDARLAIREGLHAILAMLEARRLARPDRVKTNRELVKELPDRGAPAQLTATLARLLAWYDLAFYSHQPVAAADARQFIEEVHTLVEAPR